MIDWTMPMRQTFEFWRVNTDSWLDESIIETVSSASIEWDLDSETRGTASITCSEPLDEMYVRTYLVAEQGVSRVRTCMGTHLVQVPSTSFDGKLATVTADAFTPLIELSEDMPEIGYTATSTMAVSKAGEEICMAHGRAPVTLTSVGSGAATCGLFVANMDDTWLSFLSDLLKTASLMAMVDEQGCIYFSPIPSKISLMPAFTFNDDNSSILMPDIEHERDLFGIPNVVEVVFTKGDSSTITSTIVNSDPESPTSTVSRGRRILHRETSPSLSEDAGQEEVDAYARNLLFELSSLEHKVTFSHGYVPEVRIGTCVRLNYTRAKVDASAVVISQSIACEPGCTVTAVASWTERMWLGNE